ncbi:MAG: DNA replication/repair protein RecF [Firmicutes bacterium]|nr:DNA replication/repair protein RecF [Bacillota bacterium]
MKIQNLKLINYRNYDNLDITFSDTLNLIYGNNGSGKSNLIEAIYMLALTKSFRTNNDANLIKKGTNETIIKGTVITEEKTRYQLDLSDSGKKVYIDSDKVNKMSDYVSRINIILFNPLDTKIISDSPAFRRKLLDIEISQINKEYLLLLSSYNKILKHRNAYLKQLYLNGNASSDYLDILTKKLVDFGLKIYNIRLNYIEMINEHISKIYKNIFEYGDLQIKYKSSYSKNNFDKVLENYQKNYRKEMAFGKTLLGIHHDDIDFILDGNSIKEYGSVGQQKNAIISFKLSELLIVKKIKNQYPILILDDLFSELDDKKINNIINMLNKEVQTFITTTNIDKIDKNLLKDSTIFKVEDGNIERDEING